MLKVLVKITIYLVLIFIGMEILVRVFHLHNQRPFRYLDKIGVEKWVPNQEGYSVTGNRKQNVGKYSINSFGFNSVHDSYNTYKDSLEIAIVGDSFIEGFHEDYTNSLGQQVERQIKGAKVLEFGYAGYDLADQLHLIAKYKNVFSKIDHTFIYLKYTDDLDRDVYKTSSRLSLDSPISRIVKKIKLLVYMKDIGLLDPIAKIPVRVSRFVKNKKTINKKVKNGAFFKDEVNLKRLSNFQKLLETYPINKKKYTFLLDKSLCSPLFLDYLNKEEYLMLDFNKVLESSKKETTLIYDQHWSKHGRKLMGELLVDYLGKKKIN